MKKFLTKGVLSSVLVATSLLATACPGPTPPAAENWVFRGTNVTVNESQDCTVPIILGACTGSFGDKTDETYTLSVAFRVKVGVANSAQTWVAGSRDNTTSVTQGNSSPLSGNGQNPVNINGIAPVDVLDVVTNNGALEVVGIYTWASEKDSIGNGLAADGVADLFQDALNATVAAGTIPSDLGILLDIILDNIGNALGVVVQNLPTFGLGDDVLGGGLYIGIGAKGELANIINGAIPGVSFNFSIPIADIPPDIQQGGIFTFSANKSFNNQLFDGDCPGLSIPQCGKHTYNFEVVKV